MSWDDDRPWGRGLLPRWSLTRFTPPVLDPISVAEAKSHANITSEDQDQHVWDWIQAATRKVEQDTAVALLTQTWDLTLNRLPDGFAALTLPMRPVQSVTHVKYYDSLGVLQTMTAGDYIVDLATLSIGLALNASWPSDLRTFQPVVVRFIAGYTTPDLVPADLKHAVRLLVGHFSEQRQATQAGDRPQAIEFGYDALIAPYVRHLAA